MCWLLYLLTDVDFLLHVFAPLVLSFLPESLFLVLSEDFLRSQGLCNDFPPG